MAQIAEIGRHDAHLQLLARLDAQVADFQGRGRKRKHGGRLGRLGDQKLPRLAGIDGMIEPDPANAVVVGHLASHRHAGLGRNRRPDAVKLGRYLRRLVGNRNQGQRHRIAAGNPVGVGQ